MALGARNEGARSSKSGWLALSVGAASLLAVVTLGCTAPAGGPHTTTPAARVTEEPTPRIAAVSERERVAEPEHLPTSAVFVDDEVTFPRRAQLARHGALRWRAPGPAFHAGSPEAPVSPFMGELSILEENETHARVMFGDRTMLWWRVAAFVEKADLKQTVVRTVRLELSGAAADDAYVELRPGAHIEVVASEGDRRKVRVDEDDCLQIEGWLPRDALGTTYTEDAFDDARFDRTRELTRGASLTSAPNGAAVATSRPCKFPPQVRPVGAPARGHQRVLARTYRMEIAGWVRSSGLKAIGKREYGMIGLLDPDHSSPFSVREGTALYASPTGEQVGVVRERHRAKRGRSDAGRSEVTIEIDGYGPIRLWAPEAAFVREPPRITSGWN